MNRTRIKICGITSLELAKAAVDAGADAIGLVFAEKSPRRITIDIAAEILEFLPPFVTAVGVFQLLGKGTDPRRHGGTKGRATSGPLGLNSGRRQHQAVSGINSDLERWKQMAHWIQLHGEEDEQIARTLSRGHGIIRGFPFDEAQVRRWDQCPYVKLLLIDGAMPGKGRSFRHESLAKMLPRLTKPVVIAGGLTPENVGDAIRAIRPYGVDVSSSVETEPGKKSPQLIRAFCDAVREADRN